MKVQRKYFKRFPLQMKYSLLLTLVVSSLTLILIFIVGWFIQRNYDLFTSQALSLSVQMNAILDREKNILQLSLVLIFILTFIISFICSLIITNKLAGPMMAVKRHLQYYAKNEWDRPFRLRKNDEFKDLEPLMNKIRQNHLDT